MGVGYGGVGVATVCLFNKPVPPRTASMAARESGAFCVAGEVEVRYRVFTPAPMSWASSS